MSSLFSSRGLPSRRAVAGVAFDSLAMLLLVGLACQERLPLLPVTIMGSDSEAPFRVAHLIVTGKTFIAGPHAPESGYAFYWILAPIVALSDSLRDLFRGYFVLDSLSAAFLYLGARLATGGLASARGGLPPRWLASRAVALLAGLQIALAPELVDTVQAGAHSYLAAWASALILCGVLAGSAGAGWGPFVATVALPVAAMIHPFAACLAPATLWLWWRWLRARGPVAPLLSAGLATLIAAPHLWRHLGPFLRGDFAHTQHLRTIAESNGRSPDMLAVLWRELSQLFHVGPPAWIQLHVAWFLAVPVLVLLGFVARRAGPGAGCYQRQRGRGMTREHLLAAWLLVSMASFAGMACAIGYVQQWHYRLFFPALALALAWVAVQAVGLLGWGVERALGRWGRRLSAAGCVLLVLAAAVHLGGIRPRQRDEPHLRYQSMFRTLAYTEQVADAIRADVGDRDLVIDGLQLRLESPVFDASAAVHDLLLSGLEPSRLVMGRGDMRSARFYFITIGDQAFLDHYANTPLPSGALPTVLLGPDGRADGINEAERAMLLRTDSFGHTRAWLEAACSTHPDAAVGYWRGGPRDYLALVHDEIRTEHTEAHIPPCMAAP